MCGVYCMLHVRNEQEICEHDYHSDGYHNEETCQGDYFYPKKWKCTKCGSKSMQGCFDGSCCVDTGLGRCVSVGALQRGDRVATDGGFAEELCVVKTACTSGRRLFVQFEGGLRISPGHPIRIQGEWQYPWEVGKLAISFLGWLWRVSGVFSWGTPSAAGP